MRTEKFKKTMTLPKISAEKILRRFKFLKLHNLAKWFKNCKQFRLIHPLGINLIGPFQSEKGIGTGARSIAVAIQEGPIPLSLIRFHDPGSANIDHTFMQFEEICRYWINLVHLNADSFLWYKHEQGAGFLKRRYNICFWNWELSNFPAQWVPVTEYFNEIWVPSTYTQHALMKSVNIPVRCVPYPVNVPERMPKDIDRSTFRLPDDRKIFLFAFDFNSILERKNPKAVIKAFNTAFNARNDVLLLLKTVHGNRYPEAFQEMKDLCCGMSNIVIFDEVLDRTEMYALTRLCDVFVSLHRCEGFGFHIFEAMAMGKPVIATAYSANMDYMDETNSFPVNYKLVKIRQDCGPYLKGEYWAEPDADHAAYLMRQAVDDPAKAELRARKAARDIKEKLSVHSIGKQIQSLVEEIARGNGKMR